VFTMLAAMKKSFAEIEPVLVGLSCHTKWRIWKYGVDLSDCFAGPLVSSLMTITRASWTAHNTWKVLSSDCDTHVPMCQTQYTVIRSVINRLILTSSYGLAADADMRMTVTMKSYYFVCRIWSKLRSDDT
jgi:hypothetical protein